MFQYQLVDVCGSCWTVYTRFAEREQERNESRRQTEKRNNNYNMGRPNTSPSANRSGRNNNNNNNNNNMLHKCGRCVDGVCCVLSCVAKDHRCMEVNVFIPKRGICATRTLSADQVKTITGHVCNNNSNNNNNTIERNSCVMRSVGDCGDKTCRS